MNAGSRYSVAAIWPDTTMQTSLCALDTAWFGTFWPPGAIQGDQAFNNYTFRNYLRQDNVDLRPSPSHRHSMKFLESKHGDIRKIHLRLRAFELPPTPEIADMQAVLISNDLYGSHKASAFKLAHGFTRP